MGLEKKYKTELQNWLSNENSDFNFCYTITIEPTPELAFKYEEIYQRIRKICFDFNREYQGNMFYKFKNKFDNFQFVCFKEIQKNKHYNILVHIPQRLKNRSSYAGGAATSAQKNEERQSKRLEGYNSRDTESCFFQVS